jgi:hypothetical protein
VFSGNRVCCSTSVELKNGLQDLSQDPYCGHGVVVHEVTWGVSLGGS